MHETRRGFFMVMAAAASVLAAEDGWVLAQYPPTPPPPPKPAETPNPAEIHANPQAAAAAKRAMLQQNEKEFREGVERLYQLISELREEVQKTATTDVLSIRMVKKTEEIEKLAKVLKAKAKGG
jgi:acyl-CoA reductase-like NAD-dependent aldehyde dehydrogenase